MVDSPGDAPMFVTLKLCCGTRIKNKVRKRDVRQLMTKYQIQDFQTQRIVMRPIHKLRSIALQFAKTITP